MLKPQGLNAFLVHIISDYKAASFDYSHLAPHHANTLTARRPKKVSVNIVTDMEIVADKVHKQSSGESSVIIFTYFA